MVRSECRVLLGPSTDHPPHGGIYPQTVRTIGVFVPGYPPVNGLSEQSQHGVLGVVAPASIHQLVGSEPRQSELLVQLADSQKAGSGSGSPALEIGGQAPIIGKA